MSKIRCTHCERILNEAKMTYLELSFETGRWYPPGECPEAESQGCFPFGKTCARTVLARQK
jgi:hypothetical protein